MGIFDIFNRTKKSNELNNINKVSENIKRVYEELKNRILEII